MLLKMTMVFALGCGRLSCGFHSFCATFDLSILACELNLAIFSVFLRLVSPWHGLSHLSHYDSSRPPTLLEIIDGALLVPLFFLFAPFEYVFSKDRRCALFYECELPRAPPALKHGALFF